MLHNESRKLLLEAYDKGVSASPMWQRNGKNGIALYLGTKAVTSSFWTKAAVIPI